MALEAVRRNAVVLADTLRRVCSTERPWLQNGAALTTLALGAMSVWVLFTPHSSDGPTLPIAFDVDASVVAFPFKNRVQEVQLDVGGKRDREE